MAAASGDMRRALEACTAALELKVQEAVAEQADLAANALTESRTLPALHILPAHTTPAAAVTAAVGAAAAVAASVVADMFVLPPAAGQSGLLLLW